MASGYCSEILYSPVSIVLISSLTVHWNTLYPTDNSLHFSSQGNYRIRNGTVDLTNFAAFTDNLEGYVWIIDMSLFDEMQKLHVCMRLVAEAVRLTPQNV